MKIKVNGIVIDLEGKDEGAINGEIEAAYTKGVEGLSNKNTELLGEVKDLKAKLKDAKTLDDYNAIQTKLTKAESDLETLKKEGTGDYKKLYEQAQADHRAEVEKKDATISGLQKDLDTTLVGHELSIALAEANINPVLSESATQILSAQVEVIEKDGKKVARVGDKNVKEFVGEWAATDVGKNFVLAGQSGGGSGGPGGPTNGSIDPAKFFDPKSEHYSVTEQSKVYNTDKTLYDSLSQKFAPQQVG